MARPFKQLLYGVLFAFVIGAVAWPAYRLFVPAPTCTDGILNQGEENVDCGAVCGVSCPPVLKPLQVSVTLLSNDDGSWDALAILENPNSIYGARRVTYRLDVFSDDGGTLATQRGDTYVNPIQPQYLIFPLGILGTVPANAVLTVDVDQVQWATLSLDAAGQVQFPVRDETLIPQDGGLRYQAIVINRSRFDFDIVNVTVLLEDADGATISAGSTVVRTLLVDEERGIVVDWPFSVSEVVRFRAYIGTNLFSNDNYIRTYGAPGRVPGF